MKSFLIALQLLTVFPIGRSLIVREDDLAKSASYFVIVGGLQGILLALTSYITGMAFETSLSAMVTVLVLALSNRGFHIDGLADTFDALAMKPSGEAETDREKRLAVMKDGSTGPAQPQYSFRSS